MIASTNVSSNTSKEMGKVKVLPTALPDPIKSPPKRKHRVVLEPQFVYEFPASLDDDENDEVEDTDDTEQYTSKNGSEEQSASLFSYLFCTTMHCGPRINGHQAEERRIATIEDLPPITTYEDTMMAPAGPRLISWLDEMSPRQFRHIPFEKEDTYHQETTTPTTTPPVTPPIVIKTPPPISSSSTYGEMMNVPPQVTKHSSLSMWLAQRGLQSCEPRLAQLGITRLADLAYLTDEELTTLDLEPEKKLCFHLHLAT